MVEICKATTGRFGKPCNRESILDGYCLVHFNQKEGNSKQSSKDWKDKCKNCNRPRRLFNNGLCLICKND